MAGTPPGYTVTGNVKYYFSTNGGLSYTLFDTEPVGTKTIDTASLTPGSYSFEAQYLGDGNYQQSPMSASEPFTIASPTVGVSGNATTLEGSLYAITLSVPTTFAGGITTSYVVVNWNDPAGAGITSGNPNIVYVANPAGTATGNGSGSDPGDLLAFPVNGVLTHDYTDGTVNTSDIQIQVDLVASNHVEYANAGLQTVDVLNVAAHRPDRG